MDATAQRHRAAHRRWRILLGVALAAYIAVRTQVGLDDLEPLVTMAWWMLLGGCAVAVNYHRGWLRCWQENAAARTPATVEGRSSGPARQVPAQQRAHQRTT